MFPDIDRVSRLIEEAAAAGIMPRFRRLAAAEVREKAPGDLVTIADEAVEARLAPALTSLVPGASVVGEEAAAADPNLLNRLFDDHPVWLIDPVDGTSTFAEGRPELDVMVAFSRGSQILAAWIPDPVKARTAVAAAGEVAWLGSRRLAVAVAPITVGDMAGVLLSGRFVSRELGCH